MKKILKWLLILLIVFSMLAGLAVWQFPWLLEKIGLSSQEDKQLANQAAELTLQEAELWLNQQSTKPIAVKVCPNPPCLVWQKAALPASLAVQRNSWWQTQGRSYTKKIPDIKVPPRYVIEEHQFVPEELDPDSLSKQQGYTYYRITAKATGKTEQSQAILESIYSVHFN